MRRRGDTRGKNLINDRNVAAKVLRFSFTVLSLAASFILLCLLAYMFRLTITEKDFSFREFPHRIAQDIRRLNDPNTKIQIEAGLKDFWGTMRGLFSAKNKERGD